jgi:peptidoglycan hydrolase-like protein with peptidoglycan-binding domain
LAPSVVTFGQTVLIAGQLTAPAGLSTTPVAGAKAYLQHQAVGSTEWRHAVGTHFKHTDSNGQVHWTVKPANIGRFRISFPSSPSYYPAATAPLGVKVRPIIALPHLTTAPSLTKTHIIGKMRPHLDGVVYLQRFRSGAWHRADTTKVKDGKFSFPIAPRKLGAKLKYRVAFHHDAIHLATISKTLNITVVHRTLHYGLVGPDVLALWKRLKSLHYDVGGKTRTYGWDLVHAVTAFEKVNNLTKDGNAGLAVWKTLADPKQPRLKNKAANGYAVEVNMAKEILLISKDGKLWRILDTSTGGGYTYTDSAGQPAVATTPVGHFSILYKQTGWQHSKLGYLYYPSYFTSTGVAIHGEDNGNSGSEVPSYPASHGCVRITNNAVLRYYYKVFTVGTPVWTYH